MVCAFLVCIVFCCLLFYYIVCVWCGCHVVFIFKETPMFSDGLASPSRVSHLRSPATLLQPSLAGAVDQLGLDQLGQPPGDPVQL